MSIQALFFFVLFDFFKKMITLLPTSVFVFLPILNAQYIHINYYHLQVPNFLSCYFNMIFLYFYFFLIILVCLLITSSWFYFFQIFHGLSLQLPFDCIDILFWNVIHPIHLFTCIGNEVLCCLIFHFIFFVNVLELP